MNMKDLIKDVNPNDVTVAGVVVPRPSSVSVSEWMDFWEIAEVAGSAYRSSHLEPSYLTGCKDYQNYRRS